MDKALQVVDFLVKTVLDKFKTVMADRNCPLDITYFSSTDPSEKKYSICVTTETGKMTCDFSLNMGYTEQCEWLIYWYVNNEYLGPTKINIEQIVLSIWGYMRAFNVNADVLVNVMSNIIREGKEKMGVESAFERYKQIQTTTTIDLEVDPSISNSHVYSFTMRVVFEGKNSSCYVCVYQTPENRYTVIYNNEKVCWVKSYEQSDTTELIVDCSQSTKKNTTPSGIENLQSGSHISVDNMCVWTALSRLLTLIADHA